MPTDEPYRLFPVDVARISGLTIPTIRKWSDAGLIPHIRLPNGWRKYRMSDAYKLGGHKLPPAYPYQEDKP
jgi:predicted site-specific integrase-resolvase